MLEEYPDILTVEEACEALRMGYNAMYDLLNSGKLKGFRNGRVWRGYQGIHIGKRQNQSKRGTCPVTRSLLFL